MSGRSKFGVRSICTGRVFIMLASICLLFVSQQHAQASHTNFITRNADKLMDGTSEFRFIGTNDPLLLRAWSDPAEIKDAIRSASESGIDVIRLYPFEVKMSSDPEGTHRHVMGPGVYNEDAFKLFDKILQTANEYNVRLIVPFVDSYAYIGGVADWAAFREMEASHFWSDAVIKQDFKNFIRYVLNRTNTYTGVQYKNDKAILAWQLGNEILSTDSWTTEMAAYVKSIDSNHLLADGGYVRAQGIRANAVTDPNVDIIVPHIYKYHNVDLATRLSSWRNTTLGKKVLIIGEFGDYSPEETDQLLDTVENNGTSGAMYWGSMYHHKMGGWHWPSLNGWSYLRYPGFASGDWANESAVFNSLRSYAYSMKGMPVPEWPVLDAPVLFPSDSVHTLSWLGVAGAGAYHIERSTSASGPWEVVGDGVTDDVSAPRHHTFTVPLFDDTSAEAGTSYFYRVRAENIAGVYSPFSNIIGPIAAKSSIVVDSGSSGYTETGTWGPSELPGSYGGGSRYTRTGASTVTWKASVTAPGHYHVYVRYPYYQENADDAEYTVYHNGVTNTIAAVDQTTIAGQWRLLDTVYFAADSSEYVKLTATTGGKRYMADAVMFEPVLFGDGFQNNSSGSWAPISGNWSVINDVSNVLKQTGSGIAETRGESIYSDIALTAAVKAYDHTSAGSASGIVARANADLSSFYTLRIHYGLNKVQLYKKVNGVFTIIGESDILANPGAWNLLRLELKGSLLTGYVNGVKQISGIDSSLTEGYAGLRTYDQTAVFDNIAVSPN